MEQDYAKAVKWYRKAAEQGLPGSQYTLGLCYAEGKGVEKNYKEAMKWWRRAAAQGDKEATNALTANRKQQAD